MIYSAFKNTDGNWIDAWTPEECDFDRFTKFYKPEALAEIRKRYQVGTVASATFSPYPYTNELNVPVNAIIQSLKETFRNLKAAHFNFLEDKKAYERQTGTSVSLSWTKGENGWEWRWADAAPQGTSQEPTQEPTQESPAPEQTPEPPRKTLPDTMAALGKMVEPLGRFRSKYDFSKFAISKPSSTPSLERSLKVYKTAHLYGIARALIARKHGIVFTANETWLSVRDSMRANKWMDMYREVINKNQESEEARAAATEVKEFYEKFMLGTVDIPSKKFESVKDQPWDIAHYIIYLMDYMHMSLVKTKKTRKKKKSKK